MTECVQCGAPATCEVPDLALGPQHYCHECCPWPHTVEVGT